MAFYTVRVSSIKDGTHNRPCAIFQAPSDEHAKKKFRTMRQEKEIAFVADDARYVVRISSPMEIEAYEVFMKSVYEKSMAAPKDDSRAWRTKRLVRNWWHKLYKVGIRNIHQ